MAVEITPEIRWINECYPIEERHLHVSTYLLEFNDERVLIDTGSFYHRESINDQLRELLGDSIIDVLILSNAGFVHAGNISMFVDDPDVDVICFIGSPDRHGYSNAISADPGEVVTVGGRELRFVEPIVTDLGSCAWIYDRETKALFTSDGLGHYHHPHECDSTSNQLPNGIDFQQIIDFNRHTLRWLKYVDPKKVKSAITKTFDMYDVEYLLPVHGNPIYGEQIPTYIESFTDAVTEIADGTKSEE